MLRSHRSFQGLMQSYCGIGAVYANFVLISAHGARTTHMSLQARISLSVDIQVAIEEVRRLQRFGVTAGELERYKMALLRDSAQAAEQALSVPSADQLDFIMESLALGHTVLDQRQVRGYPHIMQSGSYL